MKPTMNWKIDVVSESYYNALVGSGYAWEMYPDLPETWNKCLEILDFDKKKDYYDSVKADNFKASSEPDS